MLKMSEESRAFLEENVPETLAAGSAEEACSLLLLWMSAKKLKLEKLCTDAQIVYFDLMGNRE